MNEDLQPRKSLGVSSTGAVNPLVAKEVAEISNRKAKESKGLKP